MQAEYCGIWLVTAGLAAKDEEKSTHKKKPTDRLHRAFYAYNENAHDYASLASDQYDKPTTVSIRSRPVCRSTF